MSGRNKRPLNADSAPHLPVAAYVRVSAGHQPYSAKQQLERIKAFAIRHGFTVVLVAEEGVR
ncbi:MAG: recombinase family protein [Nibricoccus sp.]